MHQNRPFFIRKLKNYSSLAELSGLDIFIFLELFWALPPLVTGCFLVEIPQLDSTFWWVFIVSIPINIAAYILYLFAIRISPLSLSIPFPAFAISLSTAVYIIAVKRSSILFSVLLSWLVLQDADIQYRGPGTVLMFIGMIFITLLG